MADVSREDRERAAKALWPSAFADPPTLFQSHLVMVRGWVERGVPGDAEFDWRFPVAEQIAQAIATARAEGEAKGRAELGATLVRDLGAMATSLAGQSEGSTAAALKATAELAIVQARLESSNEYIFRAWQPLRNAGSEESDLPTAIEAVTQREAVHLALIAELADLFLEANGGCKCPRCVEAKPLLARARDATRNVRREDDRA